MEASNKPWPMLMVILLIGLVLGFLAANQLRCQRFQIVTQNQYVAYKIDTQTGQTWTCAVGDTWRPMATEESAQAQEE